MKTFLDAQLYTGCSSEAYEIVGSNQLGFLKLEGCSPDSVVAEIGCGCLCAGHKIIEYLNSGNYIGVDPNSWLIDAALEAKPELRSKNPRFFFNDDFSLPKSVDYIISHSILSHAAHWQLPLFFKSLRQSMQPQARIVASIRLDKKDSMDETWQYPGVSYFRWETVEAVALECGLSAVRRDDFRTMMMEKAPAHHHDWFTATSI